MWVDTIQNDDNVQRLNEGIRYQKFPLFAHILIIQTLLTLQFRSWLPNC